MYVIKKGNLYVSLPGSINSYTRDIKLAQRFNSREQAKFNKCNNEYIVNLYSEMGMEA